jgi:hypothetical protein
MAERHFSRAPAGRERRLIAQSDAPLGAFKLYDNLDATELFVDGVGELSIGPALCKIRFFKVKSAEMVNGMAVEERETSLVLVIPTSQLVEWLANFGPSLEPHIPMIERASELAIANLKKLIVERKKDGN